jgi:hypothetical protein
MSQCKCDIRDLMSVGHNADCPESKEVGGKTKSETTVCSPSVISIGGQTVIPAKTFSYSAGITKDSSTLKILRPDLSLNSHFSYVVAEDSILLAPLNTFAGSVFYLAICKSDPSVTLTFGPDYKWQRGYAPSLSNTAFIVGCVLGATHILCSCVDGLA